MTKMVQLEQTSFSLSLSLPAKSLEVKRTSVTITSKPLSDQYQRTQDAGLF